MYVRCSIWRWNPIGVGMSLKKDIVACSKNTNSFIYPLRLVVGLFAFADAPVLDPMAIFSGSLPISAAWLAVVGLFQ